MMINISVHYSGRILPDNYCEPKATTGGEPV